MRRFGDRLDVLNGLGFRLGFLLSLAILPLGLISLVQTMNLSREAARAHALRYTWAASARQFLDNIGIARAARRSAEQRQLFHDRQTVEAR